LTKIPFDRQTYWHFYLKITKVFTGKVCRISTRYYSANVAGPNEFWESSATNIWKYMEAVFVLDSDEVSKPQTFNITRTINT
jgi:hypothetical protein